MKNLYFVAHQDDELLNTGVLLVKEAALYPEDTYVILCTDGSGSGVIRVLGDKRSCWLHGGTHDYPLSKKEFSAARDREFLASCSILGVKKENTVIHKNREIDGSLSEKAAESIILDVLSLFPGENDFRIRAVSPEFRGRQNPDHRAIGITAAKLFGKGLFRELLLVKDSCFEGNCREIFPEIDFREEKAEGEHFIKIRAAADSYGLWAPEIGRFSIGRHSVNDEFEEIIKNPTVIYYIKTRL